MPWRYYVTCESVVWHRQESSSREITCLLRVANPVFPEFAADRASPGASHKHWSIDIGERITSIATHWVSKIWICLLYPQRLETGGGFKPLDGCGNTLNRILSRTSLLR